MNCQHPEEGPVNLEDLYRDMKDALDFLGLRWGEKETVQVTLAGDELVFTHGCRSVRVRIPKKASE